MLLPLLEVYTPLILNKNVFKDLFEKVFYQMMHQYQGKNICCQQNNWLYPS